MQNDDAVSISLDRSIVVRFSLYLLFCVGTAMLVLKSLTNVMPEEANLPLSSALYGFALAISAVAVIELNHPKLTRHNSKVVLLLGGLILQLALVHASKWIAETNDLSYSIAFLLTPFVLAPMVHSVLLGAPIGVFSAVYASLFGALLIGVPSTELVPAVECDGTSGKFSNYESTFIFLAVSLLTGLVAAITLRSTRRRVQLIRAGMYAGLAALVLTLAFEVVCFGDGTSQDWKLVGLAAGSALGMGLVTALLVSGVLPVLEGMFRITTDISWLELGDLNHKLLKRMQLEAPGTFHHSLVVASLAEAAAEAVGANAAMCRVCAYFHDIGKLKKPEYFIENQSDGGENPHDSLTPTMSALIIIAHVKDGVDMAIKHHLNPRVIDVIREHHGDSRVAYFYRRAQEQKRDELEKVEKKLENPEDLPKIDEKNFRYPGPRPHSRESGIISLADAIESASRSLKKPTPAKIQALVEDIIQTRLTDGQLDHCDLSLRDLSLVKERFSKTLRSVLHSRISYPQEATREPKSDAKGPDSDLEKRAAKPAVRPDAGDSKSAESNEA